MQTRSHLTAAVSKLKIDLRRSLLPRICDDSANNVGILTANSIHNPQAQGGSNHSKVAQDDCRFDYCSDDGQLLQHVLVWLRPCEGQ